ncbi:MAG: sigma-70 family RNA polymerase sigma factor, partial [Endomicrobiia bacterium]
KALYNMALRLTNNQVDAKDLVEDTFLRAFRFFSKFKKGTNIKSWLFKIMHNLFINNYKKKKKEPEILELKEEILVEQNIQQDFFYNLPDEEIHKALDSLPEEFKEVVILSDLENFSYKEISEILGCPVGTVRSRLSRGRNLLFKKLYSYAKSQGHLK